MNSWFETERIDERTFRISEPRHSEETNCWLLLGDNKALLFDTGLGAADIGEVVGGLTDKPVIALASHVHWDHIGGHRCFEEFYVHETEAEWIAGKFPLSRADVLRELGKGELPESFEWEKYELFCGRPSALLKDGDIIDLGGRTLEVIHTPGHSPGHICLWEAERRWLFTGDILYKGTVFADFPSTEPERLLESIEKLCAYPAERIFPAHHDADVAPDMPQRMLKELKELKTRGLLRHGGGCHSFGDWGIRL